MDLYHNIRINPLNMKNSLLIIFVFLLLLSACDTQKSEVRWQIKKESPAYGLTLTYYLPIDQIQKIVGKKFMPSINDEEMGYLNLAVMSADQYYLDNKDYGDMQEAHVLVLTKGSVTIPLSIGVKNQKLNDVFAKNNFNRIIGDVDLLVEEKKDSLTIKALITTKKGSITMSAKVLNKPEVLKFADLVKVTSTESPNNYFIGSESSRRIQIDSILISESGENWISKFHLPVKPDKISLNIYYTWDFIFTEKMQHDSNTK